VRLLRALAASFAVLLVLGCAGLLEQVEPAPPPSPAWVGAWEGPGMSVHIEPSGLVTIEQRGSSTTRVAAPAIRWDDDALVIGAFGLETTYRVDEPPYEHDGEWRMVLEGVPLVREAVPEDVPAPEPPTPVAPAPADAPAHAPPDAP
jgi:hypothetical protein